MQNVPDELQDEIWGLLSQFSHRARVPLLILLDGGSKREAAASISIHRTTLDNWCREDPAFKAALELCEQFGVTIYERELRERALDRRDKHSARLLELALKAKAPEYRDKTAQNLTLRLQAENASATFVGGWQPSEEERALLPAPGSDG